LSKSERAEFRRLVGSLEPPAAEAKLGRRASVWAGFWRHQALATLLIPVGLVVMVVGLVTWWPAGLLGAPFVAVGFIAASELVASRLMRLRLKRQKDEK
jgi:hypothetical protein